MGPGEGCNVLYLLTMPHFVVVVEKDQAEGAFVNVVSLKMNPSDFTAAKTKLTDMDARVSYTSLDVKRLEC